MKKDFKDVQNKYITIKRQLDKYGNVYNLMHFFNEANLIEAHQCMAANKAVGIDLIQKSDFELHLDANIQQLYNELKSGTYNPLPSRRCFIPKSDSNKMRPLSIPAYKDKLVQQIMADILNVIYEPLFYDCTFGYRPYNSAKFAIREICKFIRQHHNVYILDADIKRIL